MSFRTTIEIMDALKERIAALTKPNSTEALFEKVDFYKSSDIGRAFSDLYFTENRVCLIVPVNFRHTNQRDRLLLMSERYLTVDLLLADRSFEKGAQPAVTGDSETIGVVRMAEIIIDDFFDNPLALDDVAVEPDEGAPLLLTKDEVPNDPGRASWIQTLNLRSGMRRANVSIT